MGDVPTMTLPVSEVFGPVWQGEGPHTGRVCWFVRLGLCNLHCSWCDTPYTWDHARYDITTENPQMTLDDIMGRFTTLPDLVILSGGEPLIHQNNPIIGGLLDTILDVHIETNGTLTPNDDLTNRVKHWSVSPKLANNGADPAKRRINTDALEAFAHLADKERAVFKFVCSSPADVLEASTIADDLDLPQHSMWMMPEGRTTIEVLSTAKLLEPVVADLGYNLTLRQQVLLHGTDRGH